MLVDDKMRVAGRVQRLVVLLLGCLGWRAGGHIWLLLRCFIVDVVNSQPISIKVVDDVPVLWAKKT